jgi:hypothetical protein
MDVLNGRCLSRGNHQILIQRLPNQGRLSELCTKMRVTCGNLSQLDHILAFQKPKPIYKKDLDEYKLPAFQPQSK